MKTILLTYELLMASSRDAGNRSMREAGRDRWNEDDWNVAADAAEKLRPFLNEQDATK